MPEIVVGVDGSAGAAAAARWAAGLASAMHAEVVATNAWMPDQAEVPPDRYETMRATAADRLERELSGPVRDTNRARSVLVEHGDPAAALLDLAAADHADLIVIGARDDGPGFHLGGVAARVAHHATTPFAVVPETSAPPVERIVLGVDDSPGGAAAVAFCCRLAGALGARTTAVYAKEPLAERVPLIDPGPWRAEAAADLERWTAPLAASGVVVEPLVVDVPDPVAALVATVEAKHADLLMVGTHRLSDVTGSRLGVSGLELIDHVRRPVVVVPPESERGERAASP